jgi:serine/threonine-protein kinase
MPTQVDKYRILGEIGAGGMGVVFKAHDTVLDRVVALKIMRPDALGLSPDGVRRFHWEAQATARLSHPNIVNVHDSGEYEGYPYIAMDFVGGGSLDKHKERFADPRKAAALVEKVARAVQHAHDRRIWHRDLKPSNVLLDERDEPKVSDFGLAKLQDSDVKLTASGAIVGTPAYMAPEQAGGQSEQVSAATDVWALGVVLFELLTGTPPFTGRRNDVLHQVRTIDPPRPRGLRPALDRNLETIALKCLEKDPARRYPSAGALADDLGCWLRGEPIRARRQRWPARVVRALRRRPTLVTATAISALFAAVLVIVLVGGRSDPSEAARKNWERRLAAGEAVEIVGESGLPRYHRLRVGNGALNLSTQESNAPELAALGITLMELLPDPQREHYWFRAHMQVPSGDWGELGIYFMHSVLDSPEGPEHWYGTLTLRPDKPGTVQARLEFHRLREFPGLHVPAPGLGAVRLPAGPRQWLELAVEISPETISAFCGEKHLGVVRRPRQDACARALMDATLADGDVANGVKAPANATPPDFARRGGLGLYGRQGSACFQKIVIDPLP